MGEYNITNVAQLFAEKRIVIPVIQRDYAQGRIEESVNSIREKFIRSLFNTPNKKMDIYFIYGIDKLNDDFLPIDGQQRLTSVFLFMWFCSIKAKKTAGFNDRIKGFSYMVRPSAEGFFDTLQKIKNGDLEYKADFEKYVADEKTELKSF